MRLMSYPFRLTPNGSIASVEQKSSQAAAEQIAMLLLTERGERPMVPTFGVTSPAFWEVDPGEMALAISLYGPRVTISAVKAYYSDDATLRVSVESGPSWGEFH